MPQKSFILVGFLPLYPYYTGISFISYPSLIFLSINDPFMDEIERNK